jgi:osmotically-inducible protein OsmY
MKSDSELRTAVRDEITAQLGSHADDLDVQVQRGVVTLTGKLRSDIEKWTLCDAINGMPGVTRLTDDTMVVPESPEHLPQADAARPWFPAD